MARGEKGQHAPGETRQSALIVEVGWVRVALPASSVSEVMRPLMLRCPAELPEFVLGIAAVRGLPTPVIDLSRLLLEGLGCPPARWVLTLAESRPLVLAVTKVQGLSSFDLESFAKLTPLSGTRLQERVRGLAYRDGDLVMLLQTSRILSDQDWLALQRSQD